MADLKKQSAAQLILGALRCMEDAQRLTNPEIATLLIELVWPRYSIDSIEGAIVEEAAERLKAS